MIRIPPVPAIRPTRRRASGRSGFAIAAAMAGVATVLGGCAAPIPPAPSPTLVQSASASAATPSATAEGRSDGDGLLVAAGGALQVTRSGVLVPFDGPDALSIEVVAAGGVVVVVDATGVLRASQPATAGPRTWRAIPAAAGTPASSLIGLSPDGTTLAMVSGAMQGRAFDLVVRDVERGTESRIEVLRGLDGPPVWLGPDGVAIHAIRDGQRSGFTSVVVATGDVTDIPSYGVALSATANGGTVAFDEATTGDVLVGALLEMNDAGVGRLTRIRSPSGAGVERLAISADGRRLAVVRRTATGSTIELLAAVDGDWDLVGAIAIPGERAVSIAWLE